MSDDQELRKTPQSTWDYLKETRETARVCKWVWRELISLKARRWSKRMTIVLVVMIVFDLASPLAIRYIFDGLVSQNYQMLLVGFGGFITAMILARGVTITTSGRAKLRLELQWVM